MSLTLLSRLHHRNRQNKHSSARGSGDRLCRSLGCWRLQTDTQTPLHRYLSTLRREKQIDTKPGVVRVGVAQCVHPRSLPPNIESKSKTILAIGGLANPALGRGSNDRPACTGSEQVGHFKLSTGIHADPSLLAENLTFLRKPNICSG